MKRMRRDNLIERTAAILGNNEGASLVLVSILAILVLLSVVILRLATTTFMASSNRQLNQDQAYELAASLGSSIDALIEKTKTSIEEYKQYRLAYIANAVTRGIRPNRILKDSGIEWIGQIPEEWKVFRIENLYSERNEAGNDELPILQVSINSGISDHEVSDDETSRVFVRSEDRSKYKRVYPQDLAYNMMRAWQGAFGAVRVDGMISPAYVVAKPKNKGIIDSRYMEYLFRTQIATEEMHRYSRGIVDFRLRLYWPEFKNIRTCLPSKEEQIEIADCIDAEYEKVEQLIKEKEKFIDELNAYKKSLIYEYVTGKKEVPV